MKYQRGGASFRIGGDENTIKNLWLSAFNWGAVEEDAEPEEISPEVWAFAIREDKAVHWRENVEGLKFDTDRVETESLKSYLQKKARAWWDSIPTYRFA